ncbi:hypothetical protein Tco_0019459 [Tanacetum coccineum]
MVSPFLCSDDSEVDSESEFAEQRPERHESLAAHDAMVSRWRDRVTSRPSSPSGSSSHDTFAPSSEFPIVPVVAPPEILGPSPARRLAWRRVSHRSSDRHSSPDFTSDSSSFGSSSNSSSVHSSGFDTSDSSSERSLYSSLLSAGPSRKRCRSPTTSMPSSTLVSRLIAPTHADLLPPYKNAVVDLGICDRVGAHTEDSLGMGVEIAASDIREAEDSAGGTVEVEVDPRVGLVVDEDVHNHVTVDGAVELEAGQLIARGERAGLAHRIRRLGQESLRIRRDRDDARRRFRRLESLVERRLGFRP